MKTWKQIGYKCERVSDGNLPGNIRKYNMELKCTGAVCEIIAGRNEEGYDHVSVMMFADRLPTWNEMCEVKRAFFDDEEECVQIHPRASEYVNISEALHIWKPHNGDWSIMNRKGDEHGTIPGVNRGRTSQ